MEPSDSMVITRPTEMRTLAVWYRNLAQTTDNATIWDSRLRTANDLEEMAASIDRPPIVGPERLDRRQLSPVAAGDGVPA